MTLIRGETVLLRTFRLRIGVLVGYGEGAGSYLI